jgi:hypothetical protein
MREQTQLNENPTCAGVATEFPEQLPQITAGCRFESSRAHHIIKSIPYQEHWRHWRHQLATAANNEKQAWRGRIAGETVNASAELTNDLEQLTLNQRVQGSSPCAPTKISQRNQIGNFEILTIGFLCRVSFALFTRNSHGNIEHQ